MNGEDRLNVVDLRDALILLNKIRVLVPFAVIAVQNVAGELWDVCNQPHTELWRRTHSAQSSYRGHHYKVGLVIYKVKSL